MNYSIDKNRSVPAYLQLYEQLRRDIISGVYTCGNKLPSKRLTADETGVSVITVEHAYSLLLEEGYIEPRQRSGYYVIFRKDDGFAGSDSSAAFEPAPHAEVSSSLPGRRSPYLFPFSVLSKTMRGVLSDFGDQLLKRSPNEGLPELRTEISRYLARSRGIQVRPEQIVIGAGSEYLYSSLIGLLGARRIYGLESPSYQTIESVYKLAGVRYEMLPLGRDGIRSSVLRESCADVLHVTPYRSFPSGVTASASKRHEYLRWAEKPGRYLIEDDYESEFSVLKKPEDTLFSRSVKDNVFYLNTFSKSISPSLRVAYLLLPEDQIPRFKELLGFFSCPVPTAIQYVLAELLKNGDFERHVNRVRRLRRKEMQKKKG